MDERVDLYSFMLGVETSANLVAAQRTGIEMTIHKVRHIFENRNADHMMVEKSLDFAVDRLTEMEQSLRRMHEDIRKSPEKLRRELEERDAQRAKADTSA